MECFEISVFTLVGKTHTITVWPHETVLDGKGKIPNESIEMQRWICKGKNLEDHQTFRELGLKHGDVVHLVLKLGGGGVSFSFMEQKKQMKAGKVTESTPKSLIITRGLNIKSICDWNECSTQKYGGYFYVMRGLGTHDMCEVKIRCPECTQPARMVAPCFLDCSYRVEGVLTDSKKSIYLEGSAYGNDVEEYGENKTAEWDSLTIRCFGHAVPHVKE